VVVIVVAAAVGVLAAGVAVVVLAAGVEASDKILIVFFFIEVPSFSTKHRAKPSLVKDPLNVTDLTSDTKFC